MILKSVCSGLFVTNRSLQGEKYAVLKAALFSAAKSIGLTLTHRYNDTFATLDFLDQNPVDFVLFFDKDVLLARRLERHGLLVFNSAEAIRICDDKALTAITLQNTGIKMPRTLISPLLFNDTTVLDFDSPFLSDAINALGFPLVFKECFGSFGEQVSLIHSYEELFSAVQRVGAKPFLLQEFVATSVGRDLRLEMIGGQCVACALRQNPNDFRSNATLGGRMERYTPNQKQIATAQKACAAIGLDFGGVDLLFGKGDEVLLAEVNSNAHIYNLSACTGVDIAGLILQYILSRIDQ